MITKRNRVKIRMNDDFGVNDNDDYKDFDVEDNYDNNGDDTYQNMHILFMKRRPTAKKAA
jgi:hypothetical protein